MVFFSSCNSVKVNLYYFILLKYLIFFFCDKFHSDLLNYVDIPVLDIHGKQK